MSYYFLINNLHFAFGMIGSIMLVMTAWLFWDSYNIQKNSSVLMRSMGISLFAFWQVLHSLDVKSDVVLYIGYGFLLIGLILIIVSFIKTEKLSMNAVLVIPAFTLYSQQLSIISAILFFMIAYFAVKQWEKEYNRTWIPFAVAFLLFGLTYFLNIFDKGTDHTNFLYVFSNLVELCGTVSLGIWMWQYMRLRISESVVMLLVGVTFMLATVITLAFSTILIERVVAETSTNLATAVKVLDFSINEMKKDAMTKAQLVAADPTIIKALSSNDFELLDEQSSVLMEKYNLGFLIVTSKDGSVLVRANALSKRGDSLLGEKAFDEALLKNNITTIEDSEAEGFSVRSGYPIYNKNNAVIGTIIAGFQLDNAYVDSMKRLSGYEMYVYKGNISIAGSAFSVDGRTRLFGNKIDDTMINKIVLADGKSYTGDTDILGTQFQTSYLPLLNSDDKIVGMISSGKPQQDIINVANATNRLTLLTVLAVLLVLIFPIYFISQKISGNE